MKMQKFLRRKYQTLALLGIIAVLFYLLQCFTVSKLGQLSSKRSNSWIVDDHRAGEAGFGHDEDDKYLFKGRNRVVDSDLKFHMSFNREEHFDNEDREFKVDQNKIVLGDKDKIFHADSRVDQRDSKGRGDALPNKNLVLMSVDKQSNLETIGKHQVNNKDLISVGSSANLLGVLPVDRQMYKVDTNGLFVCLSAPEVRISVKQINDDFCDCPDSSDEPGTSGCPHSKFYCTRQLKGSPPQFIASSKVNDGICDCCDGSDEWNGALVPEYMRIKEREPLGAVFHAPCPDKCGEILALRHDEEVVRSKGRVLQKKYLQQAAESLSEAERQAFGPNGSFYPLSKECFKLKDNQYEYEVCPFVKVVQQDFPHPAVVLGRNHRVTLDKGQHLLIMDGGDNTLCPFGRGRISKIYLLCGLKDRLMRVTESELCEYTFTMSSPAAC